jgi:hypothetical protein
MDKVFTLKRGTTLQKNFFKELSALLKWHRLIINCTPSLGHFSVFPEIIVLVKNDPKLKCQNVFLLNWAKNSTKL